MGSAAKYVSSNVCLVRSFSTVRKFY